MESTLISENILKSLEARRRRRQEKPERPAHAGVRREPAPAVSACASALEKAIRDSIRSSFTTWSSRLVPAVEGLTRKTGTRPAWAPAAQDPAPGPAPRPPAAPPPAVKAARGESAPSAPSAPKAPPATAAKGHSGPPSHVPPEEGAGKGPHGDSWHDLVEAVCELRRQWDRETFEKCFAVPGEIHEEAPASAGLAEVPAPAPAPEPRRPEARAQVPAPEPPAKSLAARPPPAPSAHPALPAAPEPAAEIRQQSAGVDAGEDEVVSDKLDELIRLVKASMGERADPKGPRIPTDVSSQIAREVAGRLKETLTGLTQAGPEKSEARAPARPAPARIPLDDISGIIDQLNGTSPP